MSDTPDEKTRPEARCAGSTGSALQDYAIDLAWRIRSAVDEQGRICNSDTRVLPLVVILESLQLIYGGLPNLRDAERIDSLSKIGAEWRVIVDDRVVGSGSIRHAIDQAIERLLPNDAKLTHGVEEKL